MEYLWGHCLTVMNQSYGVYLSLFLGGLVGSLTHCTGMCSPFVLMQVGVNNSKKAWLLLPYHLGRTTTYVFLGVLVSAFSGAFLQAEIKQKIVMVLYCFMGIILLYSGIFGNRLSLNMSWMWKNALGNAWMRFLGKAVMPLSGENADMVSRYLLGIMLGFLPCGLVMMAVFLAATLSHPLESGIGMLLFAIGTLPILWIIGKFGQVMAVKYPIYVQGFVRVVMIVNAITLFLIARHGLSV